VIGRALECASGGWGAGRISAALEVPADTVRGWIRRFRVHAQQIRIVLWQLRAVVLADPAAIAATGGPLADAVAAVAAFGVAVAGRWREVGDTVSAWEAVVAAFGAAFLAPALSPVSINTSSLLPITAGGR